jgi:preprotein translocase subunit SecA
MNDIHDTFTQNFLKAQIVMEQPPPPPTSIWTPSAPTGVPTDGDGAPGQRARKRYNAFGILEDIPDEDLEPSQARGGEDAGDPVGAVDVAPAEPPKRDPVARRDPVVVGAGRTKSLAGPAGGGIPGVAGGPAGIDWSSVGRNDPCPCGSGKKFKKCHGAQL